MATTPRLGWESRHDWLFVGSTSHFPRAMKASRDRIGQHRFSRALLRKIQDRLGNLLCRAHVSSSEAASLLIQELGSIVSQIGPGRRFAGSIWSELAIKFETVGDGRARRRGPCGLSIRSRPYSLWSSFFRSDILSIASPHCRLMAD